ncbi:MAG: cytochrome c [Bryobacteraceae bacterium]|nr:cytochrome c [Bryobacteraceae bacterium]
MSRISVVAAVIGLVGFLGSCRQDMHDQPRYRPLSASRFFGDGRSARDFPEGTVARGQLRLDTAFYEGRVGTQEISSFPIPITAAVLDRGQDRYNIYCSPCHAYTGEGNGMIVQRGFTAPPSLHEARLKSATPGYIYDVITNGFGAMYSYASRLPPADRWAVVAYVRALQLSRGATLADVPEDRRPELGPRPPAPAAQPQPATPPSPVERRAR